MIERFLFLIIGFLSPAIGRMNKINYVNLAYISRYISEHWIKMFQHVMIPMAKFNYSRCLNKVIRYQCYVTKIQLSLFFT